MADAAVTADLGKRAYYLEWGKLIFGSTWFGWVVAAAIAAVHFGPTYAPGVAGYLPGAKAAVAQPTMGDVHNVALAGAASAAYCADQIGQVINRLPNPLRPPVAKK